MVKSLEMNANSDFSSSCDTQISYIVIVGVVISWSQLMRCDLKDVDETRTITNHWWEKAYEFINNEIKEQ